MKKVVNVGIGGSSFIIDEDAYQKLDLYLERFRSGMEPREAAEVMDDVEQRIAELFIEYTGGKNQVVTIAIVERVIEQLGYPEEGFSEGASRGRGRGRRSEGGYDTYNGVGEKPHKRLYRNSDDTVIGGVCSGLAAYFDVDVIIFRIIAIVALFCGTAGFWVYVVLWIAVPAARTAAEKCEMRGLPVTAENLRRFGGRR